MPAIWHIAVDGVLFGCGEPWRHVGNSWNRINDYSALMSLVTWFSWTPLPQPITLAHVFLRSRLGHSDMLDTRRDRYHMHSKGQLANPSTSTKSYMAPWVVIRRGSKYINYRYRWTFIQLGCATQRCIPKYSLVSIFRVITPYFQVGCFTFNCAWGKFSVLFI